MSQEKPTPAAKAPERFPNVDRLIELGSDKDKKGPVDPKEPREGSLWKLLLQLRPFLPYLARLVPMLDVVAAPLQSAGLSSDVRKAVAQSVAESTAKLQSAQRDLSITVTSALDQQSSQLERLEQDLTRLRQAADKFAAAEAEVARDLDRLGRLAILSAVSLGVLLVALIVMTGILMAHSH
jgi:hypothetical protein